MTDIEQKALELVNAVRWQCDWFALTAEEAERDGREFMKALCRAIKAHELDKARHAAEMREQAERFSEAAEYQDAFLAESGYDKSHNARQRLSPFILAPVDPLVGDVRDVFSMLVPVLPSCKDGELPADAMTREFMKLADEAGLAIVKKEAVNGIW